jgi:hypothetical protein
MCVWYKEFDILIFFFCFCISHAEHMHTIHELADNINIFAILMCLNFLCVKSEVKLGQIRFRLIVEILQALQPCKSCLLMDIYGFLADFVNFLLDLEFIL